MAMESLVSTQWLADELGADDLVVLDATMHLPDSPRKSSAEFAQGHIPGARFLDLVSFVDASSEVPKAVPSAEQFADRLGQLGIAPDDRVVFYDDSQIKSAARAWFIFKLYGFGEVAILDGGFAKWKREGHPLETGASSATQVEYAVPKRAGRLRSKEEMLTNCSSCSEQVVDARDAARFAGEDGNGSKGHLPGAVNVHFARLFSEDGTYRSPGQIASIFAAAGIELDGPVVTSCNSGMTACVLAFGLHIAGKEDVAVYDGSWLEWGSDPDTPKEKGAAR
jgi:thiosulfate/3-mercaptopyruvate sulfurtransferase